MTTFFFDASILGPAMAFERLRDDIIYPGHDRCPPEVRPGTLDHIWLPVAGNLGWVVIMRDKKIRTRPRERAALIEHSVGAFCLTASGNKTNWEMASLLMKWWERIEELSTAPRPYIYAVTSKGVNPLSHESMGTK